MIERQKNIWAELCREKREALTQMNGIRRSSHERRANPWQTACERLLGKLEALHDLHVRQLEIHPSATLVRLAMWMVSIESLGTQSRQIGRKTPIRRRGPYRILESSYLCLDLCRRLPIASLKSAAIQ